MGRASRPVRDADPTLSRTRFAPAPTGFLHLGHIANAIHVWGMARRARASVLLRIEDHDRGRSRPAFETALLEDLAWLGFEPDEGPVRQSDDDAPYVAALDRLAGEDLIYRCTCSRTTFAEWANDHGRAMARPGLSRRLPSGSEPMGRRSGSHSVVGQSAGWTSSSVRAPTR